MRIGSPIKKNGKWLKTKPHKLFHHLDRIKDWKDGRYTAPVFVELGPTNRCNQACRWCYTSYTHGELNLDKELYLRIISDLASAGVRSVCVQGTGEPFFNKHTADAIQLGGSLGMEMSTITNGVLINKEAAEKCVPHLSWMKISAFESTAENYAVNHGCDPKQYKMLIENIKNITAIRDSINGSEFVLSAAMLVCENNWHTIPDVVSLAKDMGFDFIQVRSPSTSEMIDYTTEADLHKKHEGVIKKAEALQEPGFIVDIRVDSFEDQNKGPFPKDYDCCYGVEFETLIDADACVYPCLRFWGDKDYIIGDLHDASFEEIWKSQRKKDIFANIWKNWDLDKCVMVCKQSFINGDLWELKNPPLHVNFP